MTLSVVLIHCCLNILWTKPGLCDNVQNKKVLLICPHSVFEPFKRSKIGIAVAKMPFLSLASLAAPLITAGHEVKILDLSVSEKPEKDLEDALRAFSPDFVGITCTTPLFSEMVYISKFVKNFNKEIIVITGGPHPSTMPEDTLKVSACDIAVVGEGDYTLPEIVSGKDWKDIKGMAFRHKEGVIVNERKPPIANLDELLMPAWHLYDLKKYKTPRLTCKKNPVGPMESSRGCVFGCIYCNKSVFGRTFRPKSVKRVVDEIEHVLNSGFKEIHIMDDGFTTDMKRAEEICDEIKKRGLDFPWNLVNGIRVDRINETLLHKMRSAGCYRASVGVESGDQSILNRINKGTTLEQIRAAFNMFKSAGMETLGFFMIALPGDTEETMRKTIDFAKELQPDIAKVSITVPFPGTPLYNEYDKLGLIKTKDWSKYGYHDPRGLYTHPNLDWDTIYKYQKMFFREVYLNPSYIARRFLRGIKTGELLYDMYYFLKSLEYGW